MDIKILITRYLENKCSQEEQQQLYELFASSENENFLEEALFETLR